MRFGECLPGVKKRMKYGRVLEIHAGTNDLTEIRLHESYFDSTSHFFPGLPNFDRILETYRNRRALS